MDDIWKEIYCQNIEEFKFIKSILTKYGLKLDCEDKVYTQQLPVNLTIHEGGRCHYNNGNKMRANLTLDGLEKYVKQVSEEPLIKIGGNRVEFFKTGIKVGCTWVDKKTVAIIYKRLFGIK